MKTKHIILIILILGIISVLVAILFYTNTKNNNTYDNYTAVADQGGVPAEKAVGTNIFINDDDARSNIPEDIYLLLQNDIDKKDAGTYVFLNYSQADNTIQYKDKDNHIWNAKLSDYGGFVFLRDWS